MLDMKRIRDDSDNVKRLLARRNSECGALVDQLLEKDKLRRAEIQRVETMQHQLRTASDNVAVLKKQNNAPAMQDAIVTLKKLSDEIKQAQPALQTLEQECTDILLSIPNTPLEDVPEGKTEANNVVVRTVGTIPSFDFTPKDHVDVGEKLGILDLKRAAKIAGARFPLLMGRGAQLERALISFMLDVHRAQGYTEVVPPFLAQPASLVGTGQLPKFEAELFKCRDDEFYLIPTAEVPLTNIRRDEILREEELPIKFTAYTPCFRREAGSYGKDTRGLIRNHQFNKVEIVQIVKPEDSLAALEQLTQDAAVVLEQLKLPYRVVCLCTGDTGFSSAKTYDLEVWMAGEQRWREISSCSVFTDFQARRLNMKYRTKDGKTSFVHTLNGSGLAVGRTFAVLLEQYQTSDGSVMIPEVLRAYIGGYSL